MKATLSRSDEERITGALDRVTDLVAGGSPPDDAIVKAASERGVPPGHVNLMVNAYNIGRSEAQRKGSADLSEKAGEFQLADASQILDRLYPAAVKSAGVLAGETVVSAEYAAPPRFLADRARREKLAAAKLDWSMGAKPAPLPPVPGKEARAAVAKLAGYKRAFEELRRAAQFHHDRATSLLTKLGELMRAPGALPFPIVRGNATALFGKTAAVAFDRLAAAHSCLAKQAQGGKHPPHPVNQQAEPYATIAQLVEACDAYGRAKEAFDKAEAAGPGQTEEVLRPFGPAAPAPGPVVGSCEKAAFMGGMFGAALGSSMGREIGSKVVKSPEALQSKMLGTMSDPQHEAALRNIQTEAMLTDLMANDDVIAGYDPNEVVGHFNEITQLSPRSANQGGLMRALLRKRLQQGALDPFEVDMLLKIEGNLKSRDNPGPQSGVMNGPPGVL